MQLPKGVSYTFAGNYEQQARASKRLAIIIPISLLLSCSFYISSLKQSQPRSFTFRVYLSRWPVGSFSYGSMVNPGL